MRLAIVGSRNFKDYERLCAEIDKVIKKWGIIETIISGGAPGADTLAEKYSRDVLKKEPVVYPADWKLGRVAGPKRNTQIVDDCTHMIAFPSQQGRGTQDSIKKAKKANKHIEVIYID